MTSGWAAASPGPDPGTGSGMGVAGARRRASWRRARATRWLPKAPHFAPRAKRVIFLFMNGGPSHVDTFDPKPMLATRSGEAAPESVRKGRNGGGKLMPSNFKFAKYGRAGIDISELYPKVAERADDLCVIRSMYTDVPNHEPALLMMNSGVIQPTRPSLGSWLTYGLGSENQDLPGFVVLCPGKPVVGPQLWSNSFLPGIFQGTHINNKAVDPKSIIAHVANQVPRQGRPARAARPAPADERAAPRIPLRRPPARGPDPVAGDGLPDAVRGPRRLRPRPRDPRHPRPLRRGEVRRRLPDRPPAGRAWRADLPGLLRRRPALGRSRRHGEPPRPRPEVRRARSPPCWPTSRPAASSTRPW